MKPPWAVVAPPGSSNRKNSDNPAVFGDMGGHGGCQRTACSGSSSGYLPARAMIHILLNTGSLRRRREESQRRAHARGRPAPSSAWTMPNVSMQSPPNLHRHSKHGCAVSDHAGVSFNYESLPGERRWRFDQTRRPLICHRARTIQHSSRAARIPSTATGPVDQLPASESVGDDEYRPVRQDRRDYDRDPLRPLFGLSWHRKRAGRDRPSTLGRGRFVPVAPRDPRTGRTQPATPRAAAGREIAEASTDKSPRRHSIVPLREHLACSRRSGCCG
jgi:hypothetical protein